MPVHRGNIGEVVLKAWNDARCADIEDSDRQKANSERSGIWIDSLAKRFREHYADKRHRLFWSRNGENREQFKLNELLFDLAVCSVSETNSLQKKAQPLQFIAQCHWQIESEFSRGNTRDIVIDMSKLVMGSAENKLFIAAHRCVPGKRHPGTVFADRRVLRRAGVFRLRFPPGRLDAGSRKSAGPA